MNDRERFIRAIEADPKADDVRLVFADWLDENGDEDRARFVRLQCEHRRAYPRAGPQIQSDHRRELEREINALLKQHREEWTAGLPAWALDSSFERGFPHIFSMTGKQFLDGAAAIRVVAPLDMLFLRLLKGRDGAVCASEHLSGVGWLRLDAAQLTDAGIAALVCNSHVRHLRRFGATRKGSLDDASDANKLTDASALALAEADNLPALTELGLDGYRKITLAACRAIIESPRRAGLTALDISAGPSGPEVAALFRGPDCRLTCLQELKPSDCKLGDTGAETLAGAVALCNLRLLWVTQNKIGDRGATVLAASPHLSGLTSLDLWTRARSGKVGIKQPLGNRR